MSEIDAPEPPDARIHEQRRAAAWAHAFVDQDLEAALRGLYANEVNVGLQTFYDGGVEVWLGDEMSGRRVSENFDANSFAEIGPWLVHTAEDYYPALKRARLTMSWGS